MNKYHTRTFINRSMAFLVNHVILEKYPLTTQSHVFIPYKKANTLNPTNLLLYNLKSIYWMQI